MRKRSILVLDCTPKNQPREGLLLKNFFHICCMYKPAKATPLCYKVTSKIAFLKKLGTRKRYDIIHISAHGSSNGIGNGSTWNATIDEIMEKKTKRYKATLVHVSACSACTKKMADAFSSKYFLAPKTDIDWIDAAMFSLLFYKRYIVDGISMRNAFEYARRSSHTCNDYPDYWVEEK